MYTFILNKKMNFDRNMFEILLQNQIMHVSPNGLTKKGKMLCVESQLFDCTTNKITFTYIIFVNRYKSRGLLVSGEYDSINVNHNIMKRLLYFTNPLSYF